MNTRPGNDQENLRALLLMAELEEGRPISQREIAGRLGIALGLVNAYLKTLMVKGFVQVQAYPRNRYSYLLTPRGFAEKSRLAYQHLSNFHKLYRITRSDSLGIFLGLRERGIARVAFCGVDDLSEIAYLSLREAQLELAAVLDAAPGGEFFEHRVLSLAEGVAAEPGMVSLIEEVALGSEVCLVSDYPAAWLLPALARNGLASHFPADKLFYIADLGGYATLFERLEAVGVIMPGHTLWVDAHSPRTSEALRRGIDAAIYVDARRLRRDLGLWRLVSLSA